LQNFKNKTIGVINNYIFNLQLSTRGFELCLQVQALYHLTDISWMIGLLPAKERRWLLLAKYQDRDLQFLYLAHHCGQFRSLNYKCFHFHLCQIITISVTFILVLRRRGQKS